jgi:hypothetical protein
MMSEARRLRVVNEHDHFVPCLGPGGGVGGGPEGRCVGLGSVAPSLITFTVVLLGT